MLQIGEGDRLCRLRYLTGILNYQKGKREGYGVNLRLVASPGCLIARALIYTRRYTLNITSMAEKRYP